MVIRRRKKKEIIGYQGKGTVEVVAPTKKGINNAIKMASNSVNKRNKPGKKPTAIFMGVKTIKPIKSK